MAPEQLSNETSNDSLDYPIVELNQFLQKKTKLTIQGSISWKIYLFPSVLNLNLSIKNGMQYFGLDLVDEGAKRSNWTHKPNIWQDFFESIQDLSKTGTVTPSSEMFSGILACPVRAIPKGPNDTKIFSQ